MTYRILIAEPSRTLASLIRLTLAPLDAELEFASDGREALAAVQQQVPDLIIADAELPSLDAYALAGALRKLTAEHRPLMLLTITSHHPVDPERIAYLGIDDVLAKPFERVALLERVRALLGLPAAPPERGRRAVKKRAPPPPSYPPPPAPDPPPAFRPRGVAHLEPNHHQPLPPAALPHETLDRMVRDAVDARLPALLTQVIEAALPAAIAAALDRALAPLVDSAVKVHLPELAGPRLAGALGTMAHEELHRAADVAVRESMPELMEYAAFGLGPKVEMALREVLPDHVRPLTERAVYKIVPDLAEAIIKDEITRLMKEEPPP